MTSTGEFLHIKRKSRSSTLSHLFSQGSVGAETFIGDGEFRDQIRAEIEATVPEDHRRKWLDLIPSGDQRVNRAQYTVSYAVIAPAQGDRPWLPFFSKLNLMQHGKRVESNLGMKVTVSRIDVTQAVTDDSSDNQADDGGRDRVQQLKAG